MANTVVFKIRHKPSGLFAKSVKHRGYGNDRIKLSVDGKVYVKPPKLPDNVFHVYYPLTFDCVGLNRVFNPWDWELVSFELKEIK